MGEKGSSRDRSALGSDRKDVDSGDGGSVTELVVSAKSPQLWRNIMTILR